MILRQWKINLRTTIKLEICVKKKLVIFFELRPARF